MQKYKHTLYKLLKSSEKYTKTDMIYLIKGGSWLTTSQVISTFAGLILLVGFANFLPTEIYGTYRYILSIIGILIIGTFTGINTVAIKTVAEGNEREFWALVLKKTYLSTASTLLCLIVSLYYYFNDNAILSLSFIIVSIGIPLAYTSGMYESLLQGRKNFKLMAQLNIISKIIITLSILITIYSTDSLLILILIYFVPEILLQFIFLQQLYKNSPPIDQTPLNANIAKFGLHLSFMDILKTVASQIDKMLIFHYLGASQLALYTIATAPPGQIKNLMQNLTTLALPKMSTAKASELASTLPKKLLRLEIVILFLVAIYWLIAPFLFNTFFPKYIDAVFLSQIYAISLIFFPRTFLSTAMVAHLKQKELYRIRIIAPTIRIIVFLIMLPLWGLWGAVIGNIVANTTTALIYRHYFYKAFPIAPSL